MNQTESKQGAFPQIDKLSLPKGGGAFSGLNESLEIGDFTGDTSFQIPIYATPCRGAQPRLSLSYYGTGGNGIFGQGFSLNLMSVSRRTGLSVPLYHDETDVFILSGAGELTPVTCDQVNGRIIRRYLPVQESSFADIRYYGSGQEAYWEIITKDNEIILLGNTPESRVCDPQEPERVYLWMISKSEDTKGNCIEYEYETETGNAYPKAVRYGNRIASMPSGRLFEIGFEYEKREDNFVSYRSGFRIETGRRCRGIYMRHHFPEAGDIQTVQSTELGYDDESGISLLSEVTRQGMARVNGAAVTESLPPLKLSYSRCDMTRGEYRTLQTPAALCSGSEENYCYQYADLFGEGIAGIVYSDSSTLLYYPPLGEGRYAVPVTLHELPKELKLNGEGCSLASLGGNGVYDLIIRKEGRAGFYLHNDSCNERQEKPFLSWQAFTAGTNLHGHGAYETADLQGDKLQHLLWPAPGGGCYFPSRKEEGLDRPVLLQVPGDFPLQSGGSEKQMVVYTDLFGDGLSHRVRVGNASVECWPNLGYGRFGEKLVLQNAPVFDAFFHTARLYFADLDGSGTADMVYVLEDRIDIYRNLSGSRFADRISVPLPETFAAGDSIGFEDMDGSGYMSLAVTKCGIQPRHYWYDLHQGVKPYLLTGIDNHMGMRQEISWSSSSRYYLEDRQMGRPWRVTLPIPVMVVSQTKTTDEITGTVLTAGYRYRDGSYDFKNHIFLGFGYTEVRQWEACAPLSWEGPRRLTKRWYHTGGTVHRYQEEFYQDQYSGKEFTDRYLVSNQAHMDQAHKAANGRLLREESYDEERMPIPVAVNQYNWKIEEKYPPAGAGKGSWLVTARESLSLLYEGCGGEPRISHSINLETDEYGNVCRSCSFDYGRLSARNIGQQESRCMVQISSYFSRTQDYRLIGIPTQRQVFLLPPDALTGRREYILSCREAEELVGRAMDNRISYGGNYHPGKLQARLCKWERSIYWNEEGTGELPTGEAALAALLHHREQAVLPEDMAKQRYGSYTDSGALAEECGYVIAEDYLWNRGLVSHYYGKEQYRLPYMQENSFAGEGEELYTRMVMEYDTYSLMPVRIRQYTGQNCPENQRSTVINYQCMQYEELLDENNNLSQVLYSPLGRVIAASLSGREGDCIQGCGKLKDYRYKEETGLEEVLKEPGTCLQNAAAYFCCDFFSWMKRREPVGSAVLSRMEQNPDSQMISCEVTHLDGRLRELEKKSRAKNGWNVNKKAYLTAAGEEYASYMPYACQEAGYTAAEAAPVPVIKEYDLQKRVVLTKTPKDYLPEQGPAGYYFSKTIHMPWETLHYDNNSTVCDTDYYKAFQREIPDTPSFRDEADALAKAAVFNAVPVRFLLNCTGGKLEERLTDEEDAAEYAYDYENRVVKAQDARLARTGRCNYRAFYDMTGQKLYVFSADKGEQLTAWNIYGLPVRLWSSASPPVRLRYDALGRLTSRAVEGVGLVERILYGESVSGAQEHNLKGHIYKHFDQAGILCCESYDILQHVTKRHRLLRRDYRTPADWERETKMEEGSWDERFRYDLQGHMLCYTAPDNSEYRIDYHLSGRPAAITLREERGDILLVKGLEWHPDGQLAAVEYGNGVTGEYRQGGLSRLLQEITARKGDILLQSMSYTYDPNGNITRIRDNRESTGISGQSIARPLWDYTYNRYEQLIRATGRELPADAAGGDYDKLEQYREEYRYDLSGNLIELIHAAPSSRYTRSFVMEENSNRMSAADGHQVSYDGRGNPLTLPTLRQLHWNWDNRLVRADIIRRNGEEDDSEYYVYDAAGMRVRRISCRKGAGIEETLYIGSFKVRRRHTSEGTPAVIQKSMDVSLGEKHLATVYRTQDKRQIRYCLTDHLNSIGLELDGEGTPVSREEYYPFGGTALYREYAGAGLRRRRFCGKERDDMTGLYYYNSRYCAGPRFLSADSLENIGFGSWLDMNLYAYCRGNPVKYTDPSGGILELVGTADERAGLLEALGGLTSQPLEQALLGGKYQVTQHEPLPAPVHGERPHGTALVRELINHEGRVLIKSVGTKALTKSLGDNQAQVELTTRRVSVLCRGTDAGGHECVGFVDMPRHIILGHELIHAMHILEHTDMMNYLTIQNEITMPATMEGVALVESDDVISQSIPIPREEAVTVGIIPGSIFTENLLRQEHGLPRRQSHL
jgi:RHS repeat-associated protein